MSGSFLRGLDKFFNKRSFVGRFESSEKKTYAKITKLSSREAELILEDMIQKGDHAELILQYPVKNGTCDFNINLNLRVPVRITSVKESGNIYSHSALYKAKAKIGSLSPDIKQSLVSIVHSN